MRESLANKYRPLVFGDVIGQNHIAKVLRVHVVTGALNPAYLFSGQHGSGKTTSARIFARALLCENPVEGDPCNVCPPCLAFLEERNPNFKEVDAATTGLVDDVRRIKEDSLYSPFKAKYKILLMDESQRMSPQGQSAFLKFLEEGSANFIVLFATTNPEKMLPAVRSRCQILNILRIAPSLIVDRLQFICDQDDIEYDVQGLELITNYTNGHVRDAIMLLDQIRVVGDISKKSVSEFLQLDLHGSYFEILRNLRDKPEISFKLVEQVLSRVDSTRLARGLSSAALTAYSFGQGVKLLAMSVESTECRYLFEVFGDGLLTVSDRFSYPSEFNDSLLYCKLFQTRNEVAVSVTEEESGQQAKKTSEEMMHGNIAKNRARRRKTDKDQTTPGSDRLPSADRVIEVLTMGLGSDGSSVDSAGFGASS